MQGVLFLLSLLLLVVEVAAVVPFICVRKRVNVFVSPHVTTSTAQELDCNPGLRGYTYKQFDGVSAAAAVIERHPTHTNIDGMLLWKD